MPVIITDSDNISSSHIAERLEIDLLSAKEIVENMVLKVYFTVDTKLPSGKIIGQSYWDSEPLRFSCRDNPKLAEAMKIIQEVIGVERHKQLIKKSNTKE